MSNRRNPKCHSKVSEELLVAPAAAAHHQNSLSQPQKQYYTSGEKSGMLVQDPTKGGSGNDVDAIFNQARQLGALEGPIDAPSSSSRSFTGTGRLLSGVTVPTAAPQQPEAVVHNIVHRHDRSATPRRPKPLYIDIPFLSSSSAASKTRLGGKLSSLFLTPKPESVPKIVDANEAISFFDAMLTSQKHHTVSQRNRLLAVVIQSGRYYDVIQMYKKLETVQSDIHTVNMLVNCYSRVGCIGYGFGLLGLILKRGLEPDVIFFTTLVKGLCFEKRVEEAGWVVGRMEELGCSPVEVMWGTFYSGLCSLGDWDAAVSLCDKIAGQCDVDSDVRVRIYLLCHTVITHFLIEKGLVVRAEEVMVEMRGKGVTPDLFAYQSFIYHWCCAGEIEKAKNMFSEMRGSGIFPTVATYNMMVHGLCRAGRFEEVQRIISDMKSSSVSPDVVTYTCLIYGLCRAGNLATARCVFDEMKKDMILPDAVTYTSLIDGLCHAGELEEAWCIFTEMKNNAISPDVVTYTSLINGFCCAGETEQAMFIFQKMKSSGPEPNLLTYSSIIHGLCRAAPIVKACDIYRSMMKTGVSLDVVAYTSLLHPFCEVGDWNTAIGIFNEMKRKSVP